jgi:hypothetical protein
VISFLNSATDPTLRRIGSSRLPRLRALRNRADYDWESPFTRSMAEETVETAEEIVFDWLSRSDAR